MPQFSAGVRVD